MNDTKKSLLQKEGKCLICERQCSVKSGNYGYCKTRINKDGTIYTLNYGNISSISINRIEKKPIYHFYPGSRALTVGFWSCNLDCPWCHNYDISKSKPKFNECLRPGDFVQIALAGSCQGTSLSFNEPTLFLEWGFEVFEIAQGKNLYNTIVTNGYMTEAALNLFINAGLNAANIDVKGDKKAVRDYCGIDVEKVWRNCKILKKNGIHLEITTLIIPTVNDNLSVLCDIGKRIRDELDTALPWHITRYYPSWQFSLPPTPIKFLEDVYHAAKEIGLKFVYLGNVEEHDYSSTFCPNCSVRLIERAGLQIKDIKIDKSLKCYNCKYDLHPYFVI